MNSLNLMNRMIGRMIRNKTQIYSFRKFSTPKEVCELKLEELTKKMEKIIEYQNYKDAKYELFQTMIIGTVLSYTVLTLCW